MEERRLSSRLIYRCAGHAAAALFEGCTETLSTHLHLLCDDSSRFMTSVHPSNTAPHVGEMMGGVGQSQKEEETHYS